MRKDITRTVFPYVIYVQSNTTLSMGNCLYFYPASRKFLVLLIPGLPQLFILQTFFKWDILKLKSNMSYEGINVSHADVFFEAPIN